MAFSIEIQNKIKDFFGDKSVDHILHIGACLAEEKPFYETLNPKKIYWYEPNPNLIPQLSEIIKTESYESLLFPVAVGKEDGKFPFHIISDDLKTNPGCSSLRHLKEHATMYPQIKFQNSISVDVVNLDNHIIENNLVRDFDFVSLDTQGNDFDILSTSNFILTAKCLVIETAEMELYEGQVIEKNLTPFLESKGFIKTFYSPWASGWGDTLYLKQ
jgi:FkbM family methyltransferase